jgi:hypothetical protein
VKNKVRRVGKHNKDKIENNIKKKSKRKAERAPKKENDKSHGAEKNIGQEKTKNRARG